jgi:hypothetical protein
VDDLSEDENDPFRAIPDADLIAIANEHRQRARTPSASHAGDADGKPIAAGSEGEEDLLLDAALQVELQRRGLQAGGDGEPATQTEPRVREPASASAPSSGSPSKARLRLKRVIAVLGLCAIPILMWCLHRRGPGRLVEPPRFLSRTGPASFAEMMSEPPTFIYGSSIHVWVYEQEAGDAVTEVAVTGHADSATCSRASGAFFNAMLQKTEEPEDLFVAGAGRLLCHEDATRRAEFAQRDTVRRFLELQQQQALARFGLDYARGTLVQSGSAVPANEKLEKQLAELDKELEALNQDADVMAFKKETASGEALAALIRETTRLSETSGLIQIHHLPAGLADAVRARIAKAAAAQATTVITFDDLLRDAKQSEAVVLVDVLRTGSAVPLVLDVPMESLSSSAFDEAVANNRQGVEYTMAGDAEARRQFYKDKLREFDEELEHCKKLTGRQRAETVTLRQRCTVDGICLASSTSEQMTRGEYCDVAIPRNAMVVRQWNAGVAEILNELEKDKASPGGRLDRMNHATIIDSLLRDWALPLSRGQEAFNQWRTELRGPTWAKLQRDLAAQGVDKAVLSGEHVIFSVKSEGAKIAIHPVHVIDLARAVVIVDPLLGATRVRDAWELREVLHEDRALPDDVRRERAVTASDRAMELLARGDAPEEQTTTLLEQAFSYDAAAAVGRIEEQYRNLMRDDRDDVAKLAEQTRPILRAAGIGAAMEQLHADQATDKDGVEALKHEIALLTTYPELPVELHLQVVIQVAALISMAEAQIAHTSERPPTWDVVESLSQEDSSRGMYPRARFAIRRLLDEDPAQIIRTGIALISGRAPGYMAAARKVRGYPEQPSGEGDKLVGAVASLSLFENGAVSLEKIRGLLVQAAAAGRAADALSTPGVLNLKTILHNLDEAAASEISEPLPLIVNARERIKGFITNKYQPDMLARVEVVSAISHGRDQLVHAASSFFDAERYWLEGLRDHARLGARARYEAGDYGNALEILFPETVALGLAFPGMSFQRLPEDWVGAAGALSVREVEHALVIAATRSGRLHDVLQITGLSQDERSDMAARIAAARLPEGGRGRVSDQVLMLALPTTGQQLAIRKFALGRARLAMLKAMVYGCAVPARDMILRSGRCLESSEPDRYDHVGSGLAIGIHVPTLEEVRTFSHGSEHR